MRASNYKDIQANTIHLENIKEIVGEIRGILKKNPDRIGK